MPKLAAHVHAIDPDGQVVVLAPGEDVPDWAVAAIRNPKAWEGGEAPAVPEPAAKPAPEPPRGGPGSGEDVWRQYATDLGIQVPEGADRNAVIALVDARKSGS